MPTNETAADFVLGACRDRQRELIARQRLYERALDAQVCALETLLSAMAPASFADVMRLAVPGERLWHRVCDAVTQEQCAGGCGTFACLGGMWDCHGPGIEAKTLWSDKSLLIRCEPGAFEAAHTQPADEHEHIIIIAGDLVIGRRSLSFGDYLRIPAGSVHGAMHTRSGCLIFTQYEPAQPV
jgi:hypothetical protein